MLRAALRTSAAGRALRGPSRFALLLVLVVALAALAAGCGGDDGGSTTSAETTTTVETTTTTETETGTGGAADGATVFADAGCGGCHELSAAGSTGTTGPSLDTSTLNVEQVEGQVRFPSGPMPSFDDQLSDEEIAAVAAYVVENRTG